MNTCFLCILCYRRLTGLCPHKCFLHCTFHLKGIRSFLSLTEPNLIPQSFTDCLFLNQDVVHNAGDSEVSSLSLCFDQEVSSPLVTCSLVPDICYEILSFPQTKIWLIFTFIDLSKYCVPGTFVNTWNETANEIKIPKRVYSPAGRNKY